MEEEDPPTGFRFYPTEEELVGFYLHNQLEGQRSYINRVIPVVDINGIEPWNLPPFAGELCQGEREQWFFLVPRQERESRGGRPNRTTASGYWKATGSPGYVYSSESKVIGVKKTMVFYRGKAPSGRKTKWKMHEYRAIESNSNTAIPKLRHEFSLIRVYVVSGSFRAFDRRPLEAPRAGLRIDGDRRGGTSAAQNQGAPNGSTSSSEETSGGGGGGDQRVGGGGDLPETSSAGGGTIWNDQASGSGSGNVIGEMDWEWEWEQLNWL